jgi:dihydrofolate reductase
MRKLTYTFSVSLDGFIDTPQGGLDWGGPDEELHRFYNDRARDIDTSLYGRRLYELMNAYWPTAHEDPDQPPYVVEFARLWQATPKVVFSRTLDAVEGNARLVKDNAVEEVRALKQQPGKDIEVGGAGLAESLMPHGLIDEYGLLVHPVVLGSGTPFFPALRDRINLRLEETSRFGSGVVYLRYSVASPPPAE